MNTYRTSALITRVPLLFSRTFWLAALLLALLVAPSGIRAQLLPLPSVPPLLPGGGVQLPVQPGVGSLTGLDRILVKPLPGADLSPLHSLLGSTVLQSFPAIGGLQIVQLPAGTLVASALSLFQQSGLVEYAEADTTVHLLAEPNDFRFYDGSLWAMKNTGQLGGTPGADIKAPQGWDVQTSAASIIVAVIDTGIRLTHEDLSGNLWTNSAEIAGNGLDDDQDGFVDDVHGINAITHTGDPTDDHGHGSHVSGTIGAVGNNSVGVVGVAWKVQLMALKFIDASGNGAVSDAITCIDYARAHHANIINASWGAPSYASAALHDAIASARTAGILFVAACGNSQGNNDTTPLYPASYNQQLDNVIAVASTNRNDGLSFFSNFGAQTVDLGAPGEDIFSCWGGNDTDYRFDSGTSMAAAHVSGVAAVVMAHTPGLTYSATKQNILNGTDPLPSLQGKCVSGGRLNLFRALGVSPPPTVPLPPTNFAATATSSTTINLTWIDNSNNEQGFTVERSPDNTTFAQIASLGANVTSYADTGLTASTTYFYRVRAFNAAGNSAYSNTANATTSAPTPTSPAPPSSLTATAASPSTINLTWTDNANDEDGFTVERSPDNTTFTQIASLGANVTNYSDTGLAASTTYYYRVRAFNAAGNSAYSNTASATTQSPPPPPPQPPAAPGNLSATATTSSAINLTWTDNANNEDGFTVERSPDNYTFAQIASLGANATSYADTGLAATTTYYYRVHAFNAAGNSPYSNTANATTSSAPPPSTLPTVTVTATEATASESGETGEFTFTRNGDLSAPLVVHYSVSGTATNGVDYQTLSGVATIPAGASSVSVKVTPIDDHLIEPPESVIVSVAADPNYRVGLLNLAVVVILDNDLFAFSLF